MSYNDIYNQLSTPKIHVNDKYASSNKLTQHVPVENKVSYSGNYAIGHNPNIGNDADALDGNYIHTFPYSFLNPDTKLSIGILSSKKIIKIYQLFRLL